MLNYFMLAINTYLLLSSSISFSLLFNLLRSHCIPLFCFFHSKHYKLIYVIKIISRVIIKCGILTTCIFILSLLKPTSKVKKKIINMQS